MRVLFQGVVKGRGRGGSESEESPADVYAGL
jgi:hypothetical protein